MSLYLSHRIASKINSDDDDDGEDDNDNDHILFTSLCNKFFLSDLDLIKFLLALLSFLSSLFLFLMTFLYSLWLSA